MAEVHQKTTLEEGLSWVLKNKLKVRLWLYKDFACRLCIGVGWLLVAEARLPSSRDSLLLLAQAVAYTWGGCVATSLVRRDL